MINNLYFVRTFDPNTFKIYVAFVYAEYPVVAKLKICKKYNLTHDKNDANLWEVNEFKDKDVIY